MRGPAPAPPPPSALAVAGYPRRVPSPKLSHVDLVVSSIERSLPFYRGRLRDAPRG